jgi:hypothetical protein
MAVVDAALRITKELNIHRGGTGKYPLIID